MVSRLRLFNGSAMFTQTLVSGMLFCAFAAAARAQASCTAIRFAPGASSATINGIAHSDSPFTCYTLTTGRGQTAALAIATRGSSDDTALTIPGVVDNRDKFTFTTEAKTYKILVYLTFARQPDKPFTMQVSVR
jgi:hypothetical protein